MILAVCNDVPSEEIVTRFALDRSYFRPSDSSARHNAFMPGNDGTVSVFRTSGLSNEEIWQLGEREVSLKRQRQLKGRLDALTSHLVGAGAQVCIDEPPVRHAVIQGFPDEPQLVLQRALDLAAAARFRSSP